MGTGGTTASPDYSNDKTKTLGMIGKGSIRVVSVDKSSTRMLNRDIPQGTFSGSAIHLIKDNTVDIYNIKSHRGLKGTIDTRMLTEDGRKSIKEDIGRSKRLGQAIGDVASKDAIELKDTFAHIGETQKDMDVQKAFVLENVGKGIKTSIIMPKEMPRTMPIQ